MNKSIFPFLVLLSILGAPVKATILNDSLPPGKNFEKAAFRLWYPDHLKDIRAIAVLVPGSNGDGRNQLVDSLAPDSRIFGKVAGFYRGKILLDDLFHPLETFKRHVFNGQVDPGGADHHCT